MSNLATIVNNILADSGIDDINVVVTTGSYSNPSWITALSWTKITDRPTTLAGYGITDAYTQTQVNTLLANYVPYSGATSSVNLGTHTLSANNLIANGGFNSGSLMLKPGTGAQTINLDYFTLTPSGTTSINFGFSTGASTWKSFSFSSVLLTNNTPTVFTLPNGGGTIAVVGGSGVGTVTSVAALTLGTSGTDLSSSVANGTTTPVITLNVPTASASNRGALSAADWTTFNNKQNALTNPVTGTGTTNYIPKFTGTSTIGNSAIQDDGSSVLIGRETFITGTNAYFQVGNAAGATGKFQIESTSGAAIIGTRDDSSILFRTNLTTKLTLNSAGNLGLGVTPSAWASNYKSYQLPVVSIYGRTDDNDRGGITSNAFFGTSGFTYVNNGFATLYEFQNGDHRWHNAPSGTAGNAISFTQAMTLFATGNLLVGTPSPISDNGARLQVSGGGYFSGNVLVGTTTARANISTDVDLNLQNGLSVVNTNTSYGQGYQYMRLMNSAGSYAGSISHTASTGIGIYSASDLLFGSSSATKMTLTSAGNLGLGVTPSAWSSGGRIEIGNDKTIVAQGPNILLGTNLYFNSGFKYVTTGASTYYYQTDGTHKWYQAPSGTAGNAISFTQAMTLFATGNLLVGSGSDNGARLQVSGLTSFTNAGNSARFISSSNDVWTTFVPQSGNSWRIQATTGSVFGIYNENSATFPLTIASTGAATFSSSVTALGAINVGSAGSLQINAGSAATPLLTQSTNYTELYRRSGGVGIYLGGTGDPANYYDNTSHFFRSSGGGSTYLTINSSGNLGLGVTPSAWFSGSVAFQIGSTGSLSARNAGVETVAISSNAILNTSGSWQYIISAAASLYETFGGQHIWRNAPSGTAGNAISFTQAMTLTAAGRLLINTPTESTFHLDVNGTGRFSQTGAVPLTVVRTSANSNVGIRYQNNTTSWYSGLASDDSFSVSFNDPNLATGQFKLTTTGAATFSSSVTATAGTFSGILQVRSTASTPSIWSGSFGGAISILGDNATSNRYIDLSIVDSTGALATQGIRLLNNGNVGIGTAIPNYLLHIAAGAANPQLQFSSTGTGSTTSDGFHIGVNNSTLNAFLLQKENAALQFLTNDTERMSIFAGGNVHIGTTPASDNGATLQVSGTTRLSGRVGVNTATVSGIQLVVQGENNGSVDFGLVVRNSSSANLFSVRNDGLVSTGTSGSILTGAPYGTTALAWKLGRFLTETASVNGSIRVQIGTRYYNIAAQDLGEVPS